MLRWLAGLLAMPMGTTGDGRQLSMSAPAAARMRGGVASLLTIGVVSLLGNHSLEHLDSVPGISTKVFRVLRSAARLVLAANKLSTGLEK